jgi:hypothetical protein
MEKKQTNYPNLKAIAVMAIFLLAAPSSLAVIFDDGDVHNITENLNDCLEIGADTTVNLDADVSEYIFVAPGGILNIYSGTVGWYIAVSPDQPDAIVTVYGTEFGGDGDFSVPGEVHFSGGILTGNYADRSSFDLLFYSNTPIYLRLPVSNDIKVMIDIKPGSNPNSINLKSRGVVPVAVLTTDEFDAGTLVPDTVKFAGASPVRGTLCDVDEDGDMDMLFHFKIRNLVELHEDSTEAKLTGDTTDGNEIEAIDEVRIVPCKKKTKHSLFSRFNSKRQRTGHSRKDH